MKIQNSKFKFKNENIYIILIGIVFTSLFFYKTVFFGKIPFPGDLLISSYQPFRSESYLGYVPGSYPHKAQYFDAIRQMYPWRKFTTESLKKGIIPLWNPYNFSGSPHMANSQTAVFYPPSIIYLFLPQDIAWTILIMFQMFLAFWGMYLFARILKLSSKASIFTAISYSGSLFMSVFSQYNTINHIIAWLPLALFLLESYIGKPQKYKLFWIFISIFCMGTAGHIQIFVYSLGIIILYLCTKFLLTSFNQKLVLPLMSTIILSLSSLSIQLLPTFEAIFYSARSAHDVSEVKEALLVQPHQLLMLFSPDVYGNPVSRNYTQRGSYPGKALYSGAIIIFLSIFSLIYLKKRKIIRFLGLLAAAILALTVRNPITELLYTSKIPFVSDSSPGNMLFILSFALSLLAGYGLDRISQITKVSYIVKALCLTLLTGAGFLAFALFTHQNPMLKQLFLNCIFFTVPFTLICLFIFQKKFRNIFYLLFIISLTSELFYYNQKFNPFVPRDIVFPQSVLADYLVQNSGFNRVWGHGYAKIDPNIQTYYNSYSPEGYDPLYPKWYGEFIHASKNGTLPVNFTDQTRSDAYIYPSFGQTGFTDNPYRKKILNLLGVKYILDHEDNGSNEITFPPASFILTDKIGKWRMFENKNALPRAFMVYDYRVYSDKSQFSEIFFDPDFNPQSTLLFDGNPLFETVKSGKGKVEILEYQLNRLSLSVTTDSNGFLFLSDTFYPGWTAIIDGYKTKILKANYAFRAIPIKSGSHRVILEYQSKSLYFGIIITIFFTVLFIIYILRLNIKSDIMKNKQK